MHSSLRRAFRHSLFAVVFLSIIPALLAQSNSGTVTGIVTDPSGAVVAGASVSVSNPVSEYSRTVTTDKAGHYQFTSLPFNPYHLAVTATGFASQSQDVDVRSTVPVSLTTVLKVGGASSTVTVEGGGDLVEDDSTFHTDVDRGLFQRVPLESQSSSLSSLVTLTSPGVAADSNGLFHGLGDHASNSFSIDGQPITDQQSKVFSNQLPTNSIQSIEVISGAPPAEFGGKTSLVIQVTTRSGQGVTTPTGSITASFGSFASANGGFDLANGGKTWGNFISLNGMNTSRFLDGPELTVMHDHGNEQNLFDRIDFKLTPADTVNLNLSFTRSWFQTPNSFDAQNATAWNGLVVNNGGIGPNGLQGGSQDQRSNI